MANFKVKERNLADKRNLADDELDEFTKTDLVAKFDVEVLFEKISSTLFHSQVISFEGESSIVCYTVFKHQIWHTIIFS